VLDYNRITLKESDREKKEGDKDAGTSAYARHVAQQSPGDNNAWKRYTLVMFACYLREELRADKIEICIGLDRFYYSLACADIHLESVRPCDVGLPPYKCSGVVHDITRFV
jgi:hypothetical protein